MNPTTHHFLPAAVASLAGLCREPGLPGRFALDCVRFTFAPDGSFEAKATDGRLAAVLSGPRTEPERPLGSFPDLHTSHATPGEPSGLVPAQLLAGAAPRNRRGSSITHFALRLATGSCEIIPWRPWRLPDLAHYGPAGQGMHPDIESVIPKAAPLASITLDASLLTRLLALVVDMHDGAQAACALEVHDGIVVVRSRSAFGLSLVAPLMGLAGHAKGGAA